jgi:hypothetical protein
MSEPTDRVVAYLDDASAPLLTEQAPAGLKLDTRALADGEHVLRIEAWDQRGHKGVSTIPFTVRNGPAITVQGLAPGDVVEGQLNIVVHAFGGGCDENWEPSQAETPAPVPTWAWVILIGVIAWAMYYVVAYWRPVAAEPTDHRDQRTLNAPAPSSATLRVAHRSMSKLPRGEAGAGTRSGVGTIV